MEQQRRRKENGEWRQEELVGLFMPTPFSIAEGYSREWIDEGAEEENFFQW